MLICDLLESLDFSCSSFSFPRVFSGPPHLIRELLRVYDHGWTCSIAELCLTLCNPMDCCMPGFPVLHQLPKLAQTHVHQVGDAIQPSHPLSSPSPPAFNLSVSWFAQDFVCALQDWSLSFPQSCRSPIIKFHWTSRPDSQGIPSLSVRSPGWKA